MHISFILVLGLCPDCWSISMTEIFWKLERYCLAYSLLSLRFLLQSGHHCRTLLSLSDEKTAHLMGQHCPICMLKVKCYQCAPRDPDATTLLPFSPLTRHWWYRWCSISNGVFIYGLFSHVVSSLDCMVSNGVMIVRDQLERLWEERSLPCLKNYPRICLLGPNKTHKAQDSLCSGWDLNQVYKSEMSLLESGDLFCRNLQSHS
jgi:hypothetical protein